MKKYLLKTGALILFVMGSVLFTSCNKGGSKEDADQHEEGQEHEEGEGNHEGHDH